MINLIIQRLNDLSNQTALLEALNWDEDLSKRFHSELQAVLLVAPPNVEKALFWLKNIPWECFDGEKLPDNVFTAVKEMMYSQQKAVYNEMKQQKILEDEGEWN